jgi:hypothetical protein
LPEGLPFWRVKQNALHAVTSHPKGRPQITTYQSTHKFPVFIDIAKDIPGKLAPQRLVQAKTAIQRLSRGVVY